MHISGAVRWACSPRAFPRAAWFPCRGSPQGAVFGTRVANRWPAKTRTWASASTGPRSSTERSARRFAGTAGCQSAGKPRLRRSRRSDRRRPAGAGQRRGPLQPGTARQITENDYVRQVVRELRSGDETWYRLSAYAKSDTPGTRLELGVDRELRRQFPLTAQYTRLVLPFQAEHENSTITLAGPAAPARLPSTRCNSISRRLSSLQFFRRGRSPHESDRDSGERADPECGRRKRRLLDSPALASGEWNRGEPLRVVGRRRQSGGRVFGAIRVSGRTGDRSRLAQSPCFARTRGRRHDGFAVRSFPCPTGRPAHGITWWRHGTPPARRRRSSCFTSTAGAAGPGVPWGERKVPSRFNIGYYWGAYADAAVDEIYCLPPRSYAGGGGLPVPTARASAARCKVRQRRG